MKVQGISKGKTQIIGIGTKKLRGGHHRGNLYNLIKILELVVLSPDLMFCMLPKFLLLNCLIQNLTVGNQYLALEVI